MTGRAPPSTLFEPKTLFEKVWAAHVVAPLGGAVSLVLIDRIWLHERTGAVALRSLKAAGRQVKVPGQAFCTMDHIVDTLPGRGDSTLMPTGAAFIQATREATRDARIRLFDLGDENQGITHVISPEQGVVLPGLTPDLPPTATPRPRAPWGPWLGAWGLRRPSTPWPPRPCGSPSREPFG